MTSVLDRMTKALPHTKLVDVQKEVSMTVSRHYLLSVILTGRKSADQHRRERRLRWLRGLPKTDQEGCTWKSTRYVFPATMMG